MARIFCVGTLKPLDKYTPTMRLEKLVGGQAKGKKLNSCDNVIIIVCIPYIVCMPYMAVA